MGTGRFFAVLICIFLTPGILFGWSLIPETKGLYENAKVSLRGEVEAYGIWYEDRDLNGYNGNGVTTDPVTGKEVRLQTEQRERWLEHYWRLYPSIGFFESKNYPDIPMLSLDMRLDIGGYIWQSENYRRIQTARYNCVQPNDTVDVLQDYEKLKVREAYIQFINPYLGLFRIGRFERKIHGMVWAAPVPRLPNWRVIVAWSKADEEKLDRNSRPTDYLDRDDRDDFRADVVYDNKISGINLAQSLSFSYGRSESAGQPDTRLYMPELYLIYDKGGLKLDMCAGYYTGTVAKLTKMKLANDMRELTNYANEVAPIITALGDEVEFPDIPIVDAVAGEKKKAHIIASYDFGFIEPEIGFGFTEGAKEYYELSAFWWNSFEPRNYRKPRKLKSLILREVEDLYYILFTSAASEFAIQQERNEYEQISLSNLTFAKAGFTIRPSEKWEIFGQVIKAWRTNTEYFEKGYWDFFCLDYANRNRFFNNEGQEIVPLVFKRTNVQYYQDVSNDMGTEFDLAITYKMYDGLEISLLGAYFKVGAFYKDVLTPKPYVVWWANRETQEPVGLPTVLTGPYRGAERYIPADSWTVQLKLDFQWMIFLKK